MLADELASRKMRITGQQTLSILFRKAGLTNLAASLIFLPLWGMACGYLIYKLDDASWLWIPALVNLWFAIALYRRYRMIADTPTSRLSSSAQGYVELEGQARLPDGEGYRGLPELPPTVWLAGFIEHQPFILEDEDGRCMLHPQSAEVFIKPADTHLYWLQAIYPGQRLYALGELKTHSADNHAKSHRQRISEILAEWKRKPRQLLENFDANGNGKLDAEEWERVKVSAANVADSMIEEQRAAPVMHVLGRPRDGRVFMITNVPPDKLAKRYRIAAWVQVALWLGSTAVAIT